MKIPAPAWLLPVVICLGMGMIYVLPSVGDIAESAVMMELPEEKDAWKFQLIPPSEAEIRTLASDTEFSKAVCMRPRPQSFFDTSDPQFDRIDFSIVLSGHDLNNSIHRPERCMPAQGHNIISSRNVSIELANGRILTVRRLLSVQSIPINEERIEFLRLNAITYYFFIGHDRITHDHLSRTFIDMKDRLMRGMDQRWAYATTSSWFGKLPWLEEEVTEEVADAKMIEFIRGIAERQIDWDQVRH
jgi:hypothetical protein